MLSQEKVIPKTGKTVEECLNVLLDEIQQAFVWSRPSILLAVHESKNDQSCAIAEIERKFGLRSLEVVSISPRNGLVNILDYIAQNLNFHQKIFSIHGLGNRLEVYDGLNMDREMMVKKKIKLILWLTVEEIILLSHRAPDFWAFRHRVVDFPTSRSTRKNNLPSGVLLWHLGNSTLDLDTVRENITFQETLLQKIHPQGETLVSHAREVGNLAYYYWLAGDNQKVNSLVLQEIEQIKLFDLKDICSLLLNIRAINCFDQGNYRDALHWIEQALEYDPAHELLWSNRGVICRSAGQANKSLSSLGKAIRLNPASFGSWEVLGYMYMSQGKFADAISRFEKALALQPGNARLHPSMAVCHYRMGNMDEFDASVQRISDGARDNGYFMVCRDGLLGDMSSALSRLKEMVASKKILPVFLRRDPNLHFIFGISALRELL